MPRMAIVGVDPESEKALGDYCEKSGNGASTFDLCKACAKEHEKTGELPPDCTPYNGEPEGKYELEGDVEHPPFEDEEYLCECCSKWLTEEDN